MGAWMEELTIRVLPQISVITDIRGGFHLFLFQSIYIDIYRYIYSERYRYIMYIYKYIIYIYIYI